LAKVKIANPLREGSTFVEELTECGLLHHLLGVRYHMVVAAVMVHHDDGSVAVVVEPAESVHG
jgi:hypothetical protein